MARVAAITGEAPPELADAADCPDEYLELWLWWQELATSRGGNGFGPNPLTYSEIAAWAALTHRAPTPAETALLTQIDAVFLSVHLKSPKETDHGKPDADSRRH